MGEEEPDEFDKLAGPQTPPAWELKIPKVAVRREWPYFKDPEDEDTESLECVANDVDSLWRGLAESSTSMDDPEFFGPTADFWFTNESVPLNMDRGNVGYGDARIALANYRYMESQWATLLAKPCWRAIKTYPPVNVLAVMMHEYFPSDFHAVQTLRFKGDQTRAIEQIEESRRAGVAIVAPTMAMFFASLWAEGIHKPEREKLPQRDDTPTPAEIETGRKILARMSARRPKVDQFRKECRNPEQAVQLRVSATKQGLIYRILMEER